MGSSLGTTPAVRRDDPAGSRHLDRLFPELEDILRAADAARGILSSPGWLALAVLVDAEIATIDRGLDGRLQESRAEYAFRHGRRGGIRFPEQVLHALIDRAESRLEEQRRRHEGDAESSPGGS